MSRPDFAHAEAELTGTPWVANVAAIAAAVATALAFVLVVFVSPEYLRPYADQAIALDPWPRAVLRLSVALAGAAGFVALATVLAVIGFAWRRARASGGVPTTVLFVVALLMAGLAVGAVLACGNPSRSAQETMIGR